MVLDQQSASKERLMQTDVLPKSLGIVSRYCSNDALSCRHVLGLFGLLRHLLVRFLG